MEAFDDGGGVDKVAPTQNTGQVGIQLLYRHPGTCHHGVH